MMTEIETYQIYAVTAGLLFCMGLAGLFLCGHFFKKIIAVKILGSATFLLLISLAKRNFIEFADPVPHAMVITGIVVSVSAGAFALGLARRIWRETGQSAFGDNS